MTKLCEINIQSGLSSILARRKKRFPQHVNRISTLGTPCVRHLYYMRHDWNQAPETDDGLQGLFETGNVLEPVIERIVSEVGLASTPRWRIVGAQLPTSDNLLKTYQVSGTIDGLLQTQDDGRWESQGVIDIKTMSPNIYPRMNTLNDLRRYPWTDRYRAQVMLYSLAHNLEWCFLLLVNKGNLYQMKFIGFTLDLDYCESLLQKAKVVNDAIDTETPPAGVNDADICPSCPFYALCSPDLTLSGDFVVSVDEDLAAILDELDELAPATKRLRELERERDRLLSKGQNMTCGDWLITWHKIVVHRKATEATEVEQWRKKIVKVAQPETESAPSV